MILFKSNANNFYSATLAQYSGSLRSDGNGLGSPIVSSALQDDIELEPELLAIQQSVRQEKNSNQSINTKVEILVSPKRHPGVLITDENANYDAPIKFIIMAVSTVMQLESFVFSFVNTVTLIFILLYL